MNLFERTKMRICDYAWTVLSISLKICWIIEAISATSSRITKFSVDYINFFMISISFDEYISECQRRKNEYNYL